MLFMLLSIFRRAVYLKSKVLKRAGRGKFYLRYGKASGGVSLFTCIDCRAVPLLSLTHSPDSCVVIKGQFSGLDSL